VETLDARADVVSGEGFLAADRLAERPSRPVLQRAIRGTERLMRARHGGMIERLAARIAAGPRARASWEMPVNTRDLSAEEKATIVPILMALAGSIRAGLDEAELGWPALVHRPSPAAGRSPGSSSPPRGEGEEDYEFPPAEADRVAVQPALARAAARETGDAAATAVSPVSSREMAGG